MKEDQPEENSTEENSTEENSTEENNTEENKKDLTVAAGTLLEYMKSKDLTLEDSICVLALATSLLNVESTVELLMRNVKVIAVPMPKPGTMMQKPSSN